MKIFLVRSFFVLSLLLSPFIYASETLVVVSELNMHQCEELLHDLQEGIGNSADPSVDAKKRKLIGQVRDQMRYLSRIPQGPSDLEAMGDLAVSRRSIDQLIEILQNPDATPYFGRWLLAAQQGFFHAAIRAMAKTPCALQFTWTPQDVEMVLPFFVNNDAGNALQSLMMNKSFVNSISKETWVAQTKRAIDFNYPSVVSRLVRFLPPGVFIKDVAILNEYAMLKNPNFEMRGAFDRAMSGNP